MNKLLENVYGIQYYSQIHSTALQTLLHFFKTQLPVMIGL